MGLIHFGSARESTRCPASEHTHGGVLLQGGVAQAIEALGLVDCYQTYSRRLAHRVPGDNINSDRTTRGIPQDVATQEEAGIKDNGTRSAIGSNTRGKDTPGSKGLLQPHTVPARVGEEKDMETMSIHISHILIRHTNKTAVHTPSRVEGSTAQVATEGLHTARRG